MTEYRAVMRHVRYWRSAIHKWSTVYPLTGSLASGGGTTVLNQLSYLENHVCFPGSRGVGGGLYEAALYDQAVGGVPILVQSYFDPATPGAWVAYDGGGWPDLALYLETAAEVALQVEWNAGLSRTGKPVRFRKWYHAVPVSEANPGAVDVAAGQVASLESSINAYISSLAPAGVLLGRSSRLASSLCTVLADYGNHQMPRGRRKAPVKVSSSVVKLPAGILVVPGSDGSLDS